MKAKRLIKLKKSTINSIKYKLLEMTKTMKLANKTTQQNIEFPLIIKLLLNPREFPIYDSKIWMLKIPNIAL